MTPLRGENPNKPTYRILRHLGNGRGDQVLLARHEIFDGECVQKTVHMHGLEDALASSEPAFLDKLDHPQIVPVREAQWDPVAENAVTFVMPHFPGGSVEQALQDGYRFSVKQAVSIAIDALSALDYLHREFRALHRDTKPGNVLLDEQRTRGYLHDFGSAASMDANRTAAAVLGTDIYRPPETRLVGRVGIDADIYGIGMMLFEMLNGRVVWEDLDLQVVEARLNRGLRAVPEAQLVFAPHTVDRLRRCVRKAIHRDRSQRFSSPGAFITALRKVSCIDWRHDEGGGLVGRWTGTWPPQMTIDRRIEYRIRSWPLQAGRDRGRLRLDSDFRRPRGSWRQAVADVTVDAGDRSAVAGFFQAVEANAAHRSPAR